MFTIYTHHSVVMLKQTNIVWLLGICTLFFLVLLILGVRKSYKLKAENEKLMKATDDLLKEDNEEYSDFTEGHMYSKSEN